MKENFHFHRANLLRSWCLETDKLTWNKPSPCRAEKGESKDCMPGHPLLDPSKHPGSQRFQLHTLPSSQRWWLLKSWQWVTVSHRSTAVTVWKLCSSSQVSHWAQDYLKLWGTANGARPQGPTYSPKSSLKANIVHTWTCSSPFWVVFLMSRIYLQLYSCKFTTHT